MVLKRGIGGDGIYMDWNGNVDVLFLLKLLMKGNVKVYELNVFGVLLFVGGV